MKKKILIIEDNLEVRENTAEILGLSNYEVLTAENGKLGVELAINEIPDLIVCDIMMPVLDGYGVYHLLNKRKETAAIPFIFLTAKSEKADFRKGMEMGADDYITKPFDGIELLNAIEVRLKKNDRIREQLSGTEELNQFITDVRLSAKVELLSDEREVITYQKKQALYKPGQRPRAVFYVIKGKVKAWRTNDEGKEFITNIYGAGDFFGYAPILEDSNYTDEAEVLEASELMLIPKEDFIRFISQDVHTATTFIKILSKSVAEKEERLFNLAYNSLRKKVAYGLVQLLEKYRQQDPKATVLNLSRENMAQTIGIATESLIRTLADFKDEKLIDIQPGKIGILDEKKLRNLPF
ncbi:response regulator [Segetibacter sp. 3557_3]|uniref:response regulator n=1 Tax=Segetibacter sp. 3557_3 TaxID=2547429 RepID=UPI0010587396|nr:response regulator [Segetibacter sp. 3557_3]TDH27030.1 response regulator [Segetibacter sp. 3557_3]